MIYLGSKNSFAEDLKPILLENRKPDQWYVEPFAGGMNMICEVRGNRIANDLHTPLIEMWKALVDGWEPQEFYSREEYDYIKENQDKISPKELGWVGFVCSYRGIYFSGYRGDVVDKASGTLKDYQISSYKNIQKQVDKMHGVVFENKPYSELVIPPNSIVYCDPPYKDTAGYSVGGFDHDAFWDWVRDLDKQGHTVFVSEYTAPEDFRCIWRKKVSAKMGGVNRGTREERLFKFGKFEWV